MLILFDLDGTLLDHEAAERSAATLLHGRINTPTPLDEFLAQWDAALEHHFARFLAGEVSYQGQRRERVRELIDASLSDGDADRLFAHYLTAYEAGWSLFSDVLPCLDAIGNYRLGVISNGQGDHQRRKLAQTGIVDRFECVLISEDCGCAKPDSTIFRSACSLLGESPESSIYIGDRYDLDAQAARTAGLRGVWLDRKGRATAEHTPPIIDSLNRVRGLLADTE
ncbi:MAG TPA: HAD family hydrolase [Candidatus Eisenbacteria bacterium]